MSKKAAKSPKEQTPYELRDVVLGKVRGFPPWPGMIVDPETVPESVTKERPTNKKTTWYCVQFFPTADHAWLVAKDISRLQKHEIEAYINEPYKRSGHLLEAYQIALDPSKWEEERQTLLAQAEEETANAEVDQLDSEDADGDDDAPKKSKKRKRDADAAPAKAKAKNKAKRGSAEPAGKKKAGGAAGTKGKKSGSKSKALVESEDDGDADGDDDDTGPKKKSARPSKKSKRDNKDKDADGEAEPLDPDAKMVREWRHSLQRTFLGGKAHPKDEDMPAVDQLFTQIEQYEKMTISHLQVSKIGKVMRHITALPPEKAPRDAEFNFKQRANALIERWHEILNANKPNGAADDGAAGDGLEVNGKSPEAAPAPAGDAVAAEEPAAPATIDVAMGEA